MNVCVCVGVGVCVCVWVCVRVISNSNIHALILSDSELIGIAQVEQLQRVTEDKSRIEQAFDQTRTHAGSVDTENRIAVIKQQRLQEDLVCPFSNLISCLTCTGKFTCV